MKMVPAELGPESVTSSEQAGAGGVADERIRCSSEFGWSGGAKSASDQEHAEPVVVAVAGGAAVKLYEAVDGFSWTVSKQAKRFGAHGFRVRPN